MNSNNNNNTSPYLHHSRARRMRKWARFDLPVIRPGMSRAKLARKLV